ncbi:hypothetical protein ACJMK2_024799 [Sinanodonta woodiana]|uniref:Uncharacterized protein n=1 Tax=Sinanodonta woodiana TaxID=1069815 RepID=A0ABD3XEZ3_SINWO
MTSTTTEGTLSPSTDVTAVTFPFMSTIYSGPETCPAGFEKCRDGKCEPFHFLCEEHSQTNPAISVIG